MKSPQGNCDDDGCVIRAYVNSEDAERLDGKRSFFAIAQPKTFEAFQLDCRYADLVVTDLVAPESCGATLVLDHGTRTERGAVSIWLSPGDFSEAANATSGAGAPGHPPNENLKIEKLKFAIPDHRAPGITRVR